VGLFARSTSIVRYLAPPPARLDRDKIARAVSRRAFREVDAAESVQAFGWVGAHDPLATDFSAADLFVQHHLVVGFRYDRRIVPPKLLHLERRREEAARRTTEESGRLGREARKQVKDEVEARLLLRALPTPRLFDCAWNLDTGHVYFSGRLRPAREAFAALFRETFGVAPIPLIPYLAVERTGLPARAVERVRAAQPASLVAAPPASAVPHLPLVEAEV